MSGYIDAVAYIIFSSIAFVFLDKLSHNVNPTMALFVLSGIALISFNMLAFNTLKKTYQSILHNPILFLTMSFALSMDWLFMLYATYLSDPFITMASLFISTAFLGFFLLYQNTRLKTHLLSMALLVVSIVLLAFGYNMQRPGTVVYGVLLGAMAGVAFFVYMITSEKLSYRGKMSSIQVLATRFWILFLGSSFFINWNELYGTIQHYGLSLAAISIGSLVVPIYFNQQAIAKLGTAITSILISFVPSTTYLIYALWNKNVLLENALVCIIITSALILPKFITGKRPL